MYSSSSASIPPESTGDGLVWSGNVDDQEVDIVVVVVVVDVHNGHEGDNIEVVVDDDIVVELREGEQKRREQMKRGVVSIILQDERSFSNLQSVRL